MNLLLIEATELGSDATVSLKGRRSDHIIHILGGKPGDRIRVGVINGPVGTGEILTVREEGRNTEVELYFTPTDNSLLQPSVDLILGLVRPIMLKRLLTQVVSLGVGRIFLIRSNRVEKSFFEASLLKDANYRQYLLQGLEQSKDTYLPQVTIHERFKPFIEDVVPGLASRYRRKFLAHPTADLDLKQIAGGSRIGGRTLLAVGPEGGWVDYEVEKFLEQSFVPVSMGRRVLRTDTAVVALLAQLMLLQEK
jgi:16S rRNA (uracil1498-N3)-methyltransferase